MLSRRFWGVTIRPLCVSVLILFIYYLFWLFICFHHICNRLWWWRYRRCSTDVSSGFASKICHGSSSRPVSCLAVALQRYHFRPNHNLDGVPCSLCFRRPSASFLTFDDFCVVFALLFVFSLWHLVCANTFLPHSTILNTSALFSVRIRRMTRLFGPVF